MKIKTSLTLSDDVLAAVDELAQDAGSRSAVVERALRSYLRRRARAAARTAELARLNRAVARLNPEVADVLTYQIPWTDE